MVFPITSNSDSVDDASFAGHSLDVFLLTHGSTRDTPNLGTCMCPMLSGGSMTSEWSQRASASCPT